MTSLTAECFTPVTFMPGSFRRIEKPRMECHRTCQLVIDVTTNGGVLFIVVRLLGA